MHPLARLTVLLMPTLARLTVLIPTLARPTMLMPTLARLTMPGAHASEANAAAHAHARKPNMPKLAMPTCSCKQA